MEDRCSAFTAESWRTKYLQKIPFLFFGGELMLHLSLRWRVSDSSHCLKQGITVYSEESIVRIFKDSDSPSRG
jgi:hypothetical protein